jgi:preprotein translocase subunit SecF
MDKKRKRLRKANKWLFRIIIVLIILLLLLLLHDNARITADFAQYRTTSTAHIQTLTEQVNALTAQNTGLENVVLTQHEQIQELKLRINGEVVNLAPPIVNDTPQVTQATQTTHVKPDFNISATDPIVTVTAVTATLVTVFNTIRALVPALP